MATAKHDQKGVHYHSNPFELLPLIGRGLKHNWLQYLAASFFLLAAITLSFAVAAIIGAAAGQTGANPSIVMVEAAVVGLILALGASFFFAPAFFKIVLAVAQNRAITLRQSFEDNWTIGVRLLLTGLLAFLAVVLGLMLFVVPGLIFLAWFCQFPYVVINENLSGFDALKRSRELASGHIVELWGALALVACGTILAFLAVVGPLLAVIAIAALAPLVPARYVQLAGLKKSGKGDNQPASLWNYAAIALALMVFASIYRYSGGGYQQVTPPSSSWLEGHRPY